MTDRLCRSRFFPAGFGSQRSYHGGFICLAQDGAETAPARSPRAACLRGPSVQGESRGIRRRLQMTPRTGRAAKSSASVHPATGAGRRGESPDNARSALPSLRGGRHRPAARSRSSTEDGSLRPPCRESMPARRDSRIGSTSDDRKTFEARNPRVDSAFPRNVDVPACTG